MVVKLNEVEGSNELVFQVDNGDEGVFLSIEDEDGDILASIIVSPSELTAAVIAVTQLTKE